MTHTNNKKYFFEINKDKRNLFYFVLKDYEGDFYLVSGSYTHKTNCKEGIKSVIRNSKNEFRFEIEQDRYERWFIWQKYRTGQIITRSREFVTIEELKNLIIDLKSLSLETPVIDKTKIIIHSNKYESGTFNPNSN